MTSTLNATIMLRTDTKHNWEAANPVLKNGEIAIVCYDNDYKDLKIGNGLSSFNQLSYLYQNEIKTSKITGKDLVVKSIAQGYNVRATPTSLATGIFIEADGQFSVVHGIEAKTREEDNYSFVFNGVNLPTISDRYQSHGEGTFNINTLNGLSGIYFGETSLYDILQQYYTKSETSSASEIKNAFDNIELVNYYKKSETSSATQIENKFGGYVQLGNTEYKNQTYDQISVGIGLQDYAKTTSIPTVNNGKLTIQRNGTTLSTFTANQSEDVTVNIKAVTGIKMNGASKGSSGTVDLGTVLTAHQSLTAYSTTEYVDNGLTSLEQSLKEYVDQKTSNAIDVMMQKQYGS